MKTQFIESLKNVVWVVAKGGTTDGWLPAKLLTLDRP